MVNCICFNQAMFVSWDYKSEVLIQTVEWTKV